MTLGPARRYAIALAAGFGLGLAALVAVNWAVDPLQFLRRAPFPMVLSENERFQNPGLVRTQDYDTLVLGSSLVRPFRAALVEPSLGGPALRVVVSQATAYELRLLLDVALRAGKARRVVRDLHFMNYVGQDDATKGTFGDFPHFLYDEARWNDLAYLVNLDTLALAARAGLARLGVLRGGTADPDALGHEALSRATGAAAVRASRDRLLAHPPVTGDLSLARMEANLRAHLIGPVAAHPEVEFLVFIPPYSAAWYDLAPRWAPSLRADFVAAKMAALRGLLALPNARVFDFQCWDEVILDPDAYIDVFHFSPDATRRMLDAMAEGRFEVTPATLGAAEACMRSLFDRSAALSALLLGDAP